MISHRQDWTYANFFSARALNADEVGCAVLVKIPDAKISPPGVMACPDEAPSSWDPDDATLCRETGGGYLVFGEKPNFGLP